MLGRAYADVRNPGALTLGLRVGNGVAWFSGKPNNSVPGASNATDREPEPEAGALATWGLTRFWALRFDFDVAFPMNRPEFGYKSGDAQRSLYKAAAA